MQRTWFRRRMDELGLSYEDVAQATNRSIDTIRTWEHRGRIPYPADAVDDWKPLLDCLKMSMLDVMIELGHDIKADYPQPQRNILDRLNKLPANKQAYCLRMLAAVLEVVETTDIIDEEL